MDEKVALFLIGIAVGIALHRLIMAMVLEKCPDTRCAYCEWCYRKKSRHDQWRLKGKMLFLRWLRRRCWDTVCWPSRYIPSNMSSALRWLARP